MALGNRQWGPAVCVGSIPNLAARSVIGEPRNDLGQVLISRAVHGGFTMGIDDIHVRTVVQEELHGLRTSGLSAGDFVRGGGTNANAGSHHERSAAVVVR